MDLTELDFEQARTRHIAFKIKLRSILYGIEMDETSVHSPYECAVGKWIYSHALYAYAHIPEMAVLEKVHEKIHIYAAGLINLYRNNHIEEARDGLADIELISAELTALLSVVEIKIKIENAPEKNDALSIQLDNYYKELIELRIAIQDLDTKEKIKEASAVKSENEIEQSLRLAIAAADMGTFDWNLATEQFFSSVRLKEIFGFKSNQNITHQNLIDIIHPDDKHIREKAIEESFSRGRLEYELRIIWPDESIHWIKVYGKILHDENNSLSRMYGLVIDITEQKNIIEELKGNEVKFRLLADSMPQFVWTADINGNLNYYSKSVYDYSGLSVAQINKDGWLQIVHPDDRDENIKAWTAAVTEGKDFLFEHRFRRYDGEFRWQLSRAVPQKDSEGNIQMWVGTSTDIHDRKLFTDELENKVNQRTEELKLINEELLRSNKDLAEFAYVASHDLQEPLRKIQTFTALLLDSEKSNLSDKGKDYFNRMQTASMRMQQLIKDLLSYSRVNTEEKHFQQTDLNKTIETVKDQLHEQIEQKHATIAFSKLPALNIIPYQFEQLFTNLISNSLKFSKEEIPLKINIKAELINADKVKALHNEVSEKYYHISIADNGIGFEPEYNERIFLVFQRLHGNEMYKGTGIGLAICKKIVENHKGIITASGELGKGATVNIYIPVL
jgi:PAS domain S-box-containing protein